jgi:iron(III) transport system permease protein
MGGLFEQNDEVLEHVLNYDFPLALETTSLLVLGTVGLAAILGVTLAALVSFCEFPGRRLFALIFAMPLTIPTYVMSFIYIGLMDFSGPLQTWLRTEQHETLLAWVPNIRSTGGAIWVFGICLYPYIYILSCGAFRSLSQRQLESSKMLGASGVSTLWRVVLPMAVPWIFSGAVLVAMETIADFGGVSAFNLTTFTTMIYKSWYGLGSFSTASTMSLTLLLPAVVLLGLQAYLGKRKKRFYSDGHHSGPNRKTLDWKCRTAATSFSLLVFIFTLALPLWQLLAWASQGDEYKTFKWSNIATSLLQATGAALLLLLLVLPLVYAKRIMKHWWNQRMVDLCLLGYGLPGTVLAVAIFRWVSTIDDQLEPWDLYLSGGLFALFFGLACRYLSVAFQPIQSQVQRVTPHMDQASRMLGSSPAASFVRVHIPVIRSSVFGAFVLVFVDVMKEMPMTLMMRPLGWDTLSVRIFEFTSEGDWEHAAIPSLIIIAFGVLPLMLYRKLDVS